jgi:thiamine pyridinylase
MRLLRRARAPFGFDRMRFGQIALILLMGALVSPAAWAETLTVALYPSVPRTAQFEAAIRAAWSKVHPADQLSFINDGNVWDGGYHTNPPANVDVFVFDAMYFEEFL